MGNFSTARSNVGRITDLKAAPMTFSPTSVFTAGKEGGLSGPAMTLRKPSPSTRLYVGNLPYQAQEDDVHRLFKANGFATAGIDMSTDPFTGRNPSYCFVDLRTAEEARTAMADLDGMEVLGRPVRIKPGVAKRPSAPAGGHAEPPRNACQYTSILAAHAASLTSHIDQATEYKPTFDRWTRTDASAHWDGAPKPGHRLYVGGLPRIDSQPAVDAEMQALFAGFELTAVSKIISPHPSKAAQPGHHFYLFVDLASGEEAERAVEALDGARGRWGGRVVVSGTHGGGGKKVIREQLEGRKGVWDEDGESVDGIRPL